MSSESIETRLAALEREVAILKRQIERPEPSPASTNWVDEVSGSMEKFPEFEEVVRLGQEWRQSQVDPC